MTHRTSTLAPCELPDEGLLLRPFEESDEPAVGKALRDAEILRWAAGSAVAQAPEADRAGAWLRPRISCWANGNAVFAVTDTSDGALLGSVSIREVNRLPDQAVVTYWVVPQARGRGVGVRALDRASRWALGTVENGGLALHRLSLDHALANPQSCRVATKGGFLLEGTMRDFYVDASGRRHDSHLHARLAVDWTEPGNRPEAQGVS